MQNFSTFVRELMPDCTESQKKNPIEKNKWLKTVKMSFPSSTVLPPWRVCLCQLSAASEQIASINSVQEEKFHILSIVELRTACTLCSDRTAQHWQKSNSPHLFHKHIKVMHKWENIPAASTAARCAATSRRRCTDWPWSSMWTLSISNEAPPSSSSAPAAAIGGAQQGGQPARGPGRVRWNPKGRRLPS